MIYSQMHRELKELEEKENKTELDYKQIAYLEKRIYDLEEMIKGERE